MLLPVPFKKIDMINFLVKEFRHCNVFRDVHSINSTCSKFIHTLKTDVVLCVYFTTLSSLPYSVEVVIYPFFEKCYLEQHFL